MSMSAALPFVFGSNIGTTITGVFAAIGGSLAAKRTAGLHTLFNVIGTLIGMLLLQPYILLIQKLSAMLNIAPMMQIAVAHILFNVGATILFFPFLKQMCQLVKKLIPGQEPERLDIYAAGRSDGHFRGRLRRWSLSTSRSLKWLTL